MAFSVSDYQDLLKLLRDHPEWKAELRQEILDDEFLRLPQYVRQNSEDIRALQEMVAQNSEDIRALRFAIADLQAATQRNTDAITSLITQFSGTTTRQDTMQIRLDEMSSLLFERKFAERPWSYFGHMIRKAKAVAPEDLEHFSAALDTNTITDAEADGVRRLDVIVRGVDPTRKPAHQVLLAVEASLTVDRGDVERAAVRAEVLRKVGYADVRPVAAGHQVTQGASDIAPLLDVHLLIEEPETVGA